MGMRICDQQGNVLTGATHDAAKRFDRALTSFNIYRGDPLADLDLAIVAAPGFTMGHIAKAFLLGLATEPDATAAAVNEMQLLRTMPLSEREASLARALDQVLAGRWTDAATTLDQHNSEYPLDMLGLQTGHLIDFYRASSRGLRDRIARVLPEWSPSVPGYPIVLGMYAFGLEEAGDYAKAEDTGRHAVELEPLDCWTHHAVAHVYEMQGRPQDGVQWMAQNEKNWSGSDNFFQGHNWWHYAVYLIALGEYDQALRLYDKHIGAEESPVALNLVDAAAMLWRLSLVGIDVGDRWLPVAERWDQHVDGLSYSFNDWHAVMANLGAGRTDRVNEILQLLRQASTQAGEPAEWVSAMVYPCV